MDSFIRYDIVKYIENNNLFNCNQHGFRKGHSCVTQLLKVVEFWTDALDETFSVDTIYLNIEEKALFTIPHNGSITKLIFYGINNQVIKWVKQVLGG